MTITEIAQVIVNDIRKVADYQEDDVFISEISDNTIARCRFWYTCKDDRFRFRFHISISDEYIIIQYYGRVCNYPIIDYTNINDYLDNIIEKFISGESCHGSISSGSNI